MNFPRELVAIAAGLGSAFSWGTSDFAGGLATRKGNVYSVVVISELIGLTALLGFALLSGEAIPPLTHLLWAGAAGITGSIGLAALYQAMANGQMGIAAPVSAVLAAGIPVLVGAFLEGLPGPLKIAGFGLGLVGLWLISRPEKAEAAPAGFRLALLAGLGFAGFFVFIDQASRQALFWPLVASRSASLILMAAIVAALKLPWQPGRDALPLIVFAGLGDVGGNVFYTLAAQSGRMDVSAVLASVSPMFTVILALVIVKERLNRWQTIGILMLAGAIVLFAIREGSAL